LPKNPVNSAIADQVGKGKGIRFLFFNFFFPRRFNQIAQKNRRRVDEQSRVKSSAN